MPLRDHFSADSTFAQTWEQVHGAWPTYIAEYLNSILPPDYRSGVLISFGTAVEVDVAAFRRSEEPDLTTTEATPWEPAAPTLLLETEEFPPAEY